MSRGHPTPPGQTGSAPPGSSSLHATTASVEAAVASAGPSTSSSNAAATASVLMDPTANTGRNWSPF
jgi:hypothetical protein